MPPIDTLQKLQQDLIRKTLNGSVFVNPVPDTAVDEATLFDAATGDLTALPAGFNDLGYLDNTGAKFGRSTTETNVTSWQSRTPTRVDITADTTTLAVVAQETNLHTISLYTGADTSALVAGTNGVVRLDMPAIAANKYYTVLSLAVDETNEGEIVLARYLPKAKVTTFGDQSYDEGDGVLYPLTFTAFVGASGSPQSFIYGGAGWNARLAAMGFNKVVTVSTTSGSTTLVATTGTFSASDVGHTVTGAGIPAGTTIATFTDATHVEMSAAATATATGVTVTIS